MTNIQEHINMRKIENKLNSDWFSGIFLVIPAVESAKGKEAFNTDTYYNTINTVSQLIRNK